MNKRHWKLICILLLCLLPCLAGAQGRFDVRANYTKTDVAIAMRDGTKLYTVIFAPKDTSQNHPMLLERTPYSVPYGPDAFPNSLGPSSHFAENGYIVAYQDVRGRYMSEGDYVNVRPQLTGKHGKADIDESTDTYDTIDWLVRNVPHNNGRVGMWGISYPGFYAAAGAINAHPALKAVSPQAPIADWFLGDDEHHNGAFYLLDNFAWDFNSRFDWPRTGPSRVQLPTGLRYDSNDSYQFYLDLGPLSNANARYFHNQVPFWNEMMQHGTYDAYWKARNLLPHFKDVRPAMLLVGGWFDAEDFYGPLHIFKTIEKASPTTPNYLVVGPWPHGGWAGGDRSSFGDIPFGSATAATYRNEIEFPFFNHYLKDEGDWKESKARVFATGSNQWLSFDAWPPRALQAQSLYFGAEHRLASSPSQAGKSAIKSTIKSTISAANGRVRDSNAGKRRQLCQRPGQTRAVCRYRVAKHPPQQQLHDCRPAFCRRTRRCSHLQNRADGAGHDRCRADYRRPVCVHIRHGFRLGCENHRRVPRRRARYRVRNGNREDGRLPNAGTRRRDARQVPQQF